MNYTLLRKLADAVEENDKMTRRLYAKSKRAALEHGETITKQEREELSSSNARVKSLRRDVLADMGLYESKAAQASLVERFGEPIGTAPATPGVPDERDTCEGCGGPLSPSGTCELCEPGYDDEMDEVAPPGWEGTVKAMKKHKRIENPWALSWSMKNKGYHSHKK